MKAEHLTDRIVMDGACIGCGLCAGVSKGSIEMAFTPEMRERPVVVGEVDQSTHAIIEAACPGLQVEGLSVDESGTDTAFDPVWGYVRRGIYGWAAEQDIRHRASTGGVLSALAAWLLKSKRVDFILHLGPDPDYPARSRWKISTTPEQAADTGGSRYGPSAPLAGIPEAERRIKDGAERFAFIGKPCDVSAIRLLAKQETWLSDSLYCCMTIMCGGASEFEKTLNLLDEWELKESDLAALRYRGFGNPGPTTATTKDGRTKSTTYQELWEDESKWALQHRCKICADAIGMAADVVSFDCWPGGGPTGEDDGFNAIITRTPLGDEMVAHAKADHFLCTGEPLNSDDFLNFQPHQDRKRRAVWARLAGQKFAGKTFPGTINLGTQDLAIGNSLQMNLQQAKGTRDRLRQGRGTEPIPTKAI